MLTPAAAVLAAFLALAPASSVQDWVVETIYAAAAYYGVSSRVMLEISWTESRHGYYVYNLAGSGAVGVFQFMPGTWVWASRRSGYAGYPATDIEANIWTAAWLLSTPGGICHWRPWVCRRR